MCNKKKDYIQQQKINHFEMILKANKENKKIQYKDRKRSDTKVSRFIC